MGRASAEAIRTLRDCPDVTLDVGSACPRPQDSCYRHGRLSARTRRSRAREHAASSRPSRSIPRRRNTKYHRRGAGGRARGRTPSLLLSLRKTGSEYFEESQPPGLHATATEPEPVKIPAVRRPLLKRLAVRRTAFLTLACSRLALPRGRHWGSLRDEKQPYFASVNREHKPFWMLGGANPHSRGAIREAINPTAHHRRMDERTRVHEASSRPSGGSKCIRTRNVTLSQHSEQVRRCRSIARLSCHGARPRA